MGKKSKKTTSTTVYGNTTTTNPYVTSTTNNKGTVSTFNPNTAFSSINDFVNNNFDQLLAEYLNPTLNSITNKAKMNAFADSLNDSSVMYLENNIINPLSKRNMIRSSQATDMYNKMLQNNTNQIANYAQELLGTSQKDTASMLANLMLLYMNGYNALNDTQKQSLATSQGNASRTNMSGDASYANTSQMMQMATQMAMLMASAL